MDSQDAFTYEQADAADLADYLRVIRARWWVIVLCVVVVLGASVYSSANKTPLYQATAKIVRQQGSLEAALFGTSFLQYQDPVRLTQTAAGLVTVEQVAALVKAELGSPLSPEELSRMVTATPDTKSDVISIKAVSTSAKEAADVANAFARQFIVYRQTTDKSLLEVAKQVLEKQIASLSKADVGSDLARSLQQRLEEIGIIEEIQTGGFMVSQPAKAPGLPFSPQPLRNAVLALVVGLVLGVGLAFLLEYMDRRIKDEQTLEKVFGLPVLATVPLVDVGWRQRRGRRKSRSDVPIGFADKHSPLIESFRTLRSNLQYFGVDTEIRTILVTSPLPREGKSTVSINLGLGLALSGLRVIVLEADLRRPMLHTYLKLGNDVGISNVLAGTHTFSEAMQLVKVDDYMPEDTRERIPAGGEDLLLQKNLYCITSGPLPPNPSELMGSTKMQELLRSAAETADYVIIDTPPLLLAADAVTLSAHVDGVLLTARLFSTTRDDAQAARELLERVGARVIGAVAFGGRLSHSYYRRGYYRGYRRYGYGYGRGYGYGYGEDVQEPAGVSSTET
jgi:Mrp family chromosome partitioning ATPase/capsular polysaccharide biosynthesis protein